MSAKYLPKYLNAACALMTLLAPVLPSRAQTGDRGAEQQALADTVQKKLNKDHRGQPGFTPAVIAAMRATPRHLFVPATEQASAYQDRPLPIGHGQTISDPLIVAWMTSLLHVKRRDTVLEIGTGSGYQAAVLSKLAAQVYSIEIVEPLAQEASERLARLGYANVSVRAGDGYAGWPEHQPFDAIIVTAGAPRVPPALLAQLKPGGRMVMPLGPHWAQEQIVLIKKSRRGTVKQRTLGQVFFVDFTGEMQRSATEVRP